MIDDLGEVFLGHRDGDPRVAVGIVDSVRLRVAVNIDEAVLAEVEFDGRFDSRIGPNRLADTLCQLFQVHTRFSELRPIRLLVLSSIVDDDHSVFYADIVCPDWILAW